MSKGVLVAFGILGFAMYLCGCSDAHPVAASAASLPAQIQTSIAAKPQEQFYVASGPLVVENTLDVAAERAGVVATINAEPGTRVAKNQVLAQLDDRQISADLEAAHAKTRSIEADLKNWEAEAKVLEADYQRAQKMWDAQLITKEQLEHARYKAESDQWDVKRVRELLLNSQATERSLELELEKTRIRAPFAGIVARRYIRVGQRISPGDRTFWVTVEGPLRVKFTLPERFVGHIQRGEVVEVISPDLPDAKRAGKVIEVSPIVDPSSGTIEVVAEVMGGHGQLYPGMMANIRLNQPQ
jgi:RND family efflux transporter MFP subunit